MAFEPCLIDLNSDGFANIRLLSILQSGRPKGSGQARQSLSTFVKQFQ